MPHLVLADDSPAIRKIVELSLAGEDVLVHCFADGPSALEYMESQTVDLLLADVSLPHLDGYALCRSVKRNPSTAHVRVVLLVGVFEHFDARQAEEAGYDLQLTKPLATSQLVALLRELRERPAPPAARPLVRQGQRAAKDVSSAVSPPGKTLFPLTASQCGPLPPSYHRVPSPPPRTATAAALLPATLSDREVDFLATELLRRLGPELRRLLPEIARDLVRRRRP